MAEDRPDSARVRASPAASAGRNAAGLLALGVRVRLEADGPGRLCALLDRVPPDWIDGETRAPADCRLRWHSPTLPRPQRLLLDDDVVVTACRPEDLLDRFEHELLAAVAARTRRVVLHAGAVVHRGRAVLLPGRSFCGKSTLVHALAAAGATYYSDDVAPIDGRGRVCAVPKRLALRRGARHAASVDASDLGWHQSCPPRPVALIVLARYRPGVAFLPRRLSPGQATLALFRHTVSAQAAPERAFRVLAALAAGGPVLAGDRGGATGTAAAILEMMNKDGANDA